jgi:hypothetical protein
MTSLVLLAALSVPAHHHHCAPGGPYNGHGLCSAFAPKPYGCYGYIPWGCCGVVAPHLLSGPSAPNVSPAEEKLWMDYIHELGFQDRGGMMSVWQQADLEGRKKLISLLAKLRADMDKKDGGEKKEEPPISAEEEKKWMTHLGTLKGDELDKARKAWAAADVAGKRAPLKRLEK